MTETEIEQYIVSHLRVAGARHQPFTPGAIRRIAHYSRGIPRLVNMLCDHCLLSAYANQTREVSDQIARRAIQYLEDGESVGGWKHQLRAGRRYSRRILLAASAGAVAAAATMIGVASPSAYQSAVHAVSVTMGTPIGGVVRWLTTWWGS
jgi:hypothetical protein